MAALISVRKEIWKLPMKLVRWRTHFDPKHPRPPHFRRAKFLAAVEPIYAENRTPPQLMCDFVQHKIETHRPPIKVEILMAEEMRAEMEKSEFIAIYHLNHLFQDDVLDAQRFFFHQGLRYYVKSTEILSLAVQNTKFEVLNHFFNCLKFEAIAFGDHKSDVIKILKLEKKTPKHILLGGILEEKLMSRNDLISYSKLPELPIARAQLCNTLTQAAQRISSHLTHQQFNLSLMLNQYSQKSE